MPLHHIYIYIYIYIQDHSEVYDVETVDLAAYLRHVARPKVIVTRTGDSDE